MRPGAAFWRGTRACILGGCVVLAIFGLYPQLDRTVGNISQLFVQRAAVERATVGATERIRLKARRATLIAARDSVLTLPPPESYAMVLMAIRLAADSSGVHVLEIRPEASVIDGDFTLVPLEIQTGGDYHQIARFVDQLERSTYVMVVDSIHLLQGATALPIEAALRVTVLTGCEAGCDR